MKTQEHTVGLDITMEMNPQPELRLRYNDIFMNTTINSTLKIRPYLFEKFKEIFINKGIKLFFNFIFKTLSPKIKKIGSQIENLLNCF